MSHRSGSHAGRSLSVVAAAAVLAACIPAAAQLGGRDDGLLLETEAVVPTPPELVCAPMVTQADWSSDGGYVLAVRTSMRVTQQALSALLSGAQPAALPPGDTSLVIWNARTRTAVEVWKRPMASVSVRQARWLPGSHVVLADVQVRAAPDTGRGPQAPPEARRVVLRIDAETGQVRSLVQLSALQSPEVTFSPSQPYAVLRAAAAPAPGVAPREAYQVIRAGGSLTAPAVVAENVYALAVEWATDGSPVLHTMEPGPAPEAKRVHRWYALSPQTGAVKALAGQPPIYVPRPSEGPLALRPSPQVLKVGGASRTISSLWLEGPAAGPDDSASRLLVCADAQSGALSPRGDAVLYVAQGSALVTPLLRVPRKLLEEARDVARRTAAMSNAKQLGLALLMYAQDHDQQLPPAGDDVNGLLLPYLRNDRLFEGFVYTCAGGPLSAIERPAETVLGYVVGPGGRADLYADGHVKWHSDAADG